MKYLLLVATLSLVTSVGHGERAPTLTPITDQETKEYLFDKAVRLSGLPAYPTTEMPAMFLISKKDLDREVCPATPESCRNLAAVFDDLGYRILIRDDLDISSNFQAFNYSFVIHELVHSLQYRNRGPEIFNGCAAIYQTELEAYTAQDGYLKEEGEFFRAGIALKYFFCDEEEAKAEYLKSKAVWDYRRSTGKWPN